MHTNTGCRRVANFSKNVASSWLVKVDNFKSSHGGSVCSTVDGTFSQAALKGKIQIKEQLPKYFGGEVQLGEFVLLLGNGRQYAMSTIVNCRIFFPDVSQASIFSFSKTAKTYLSNSIPLGNTQHSQLIIMVFPWHILYTYMCIPTCV